jgi:hypothetical protein
MNDEEKEIRKPMRNPISFEGFKAMHQIRSHGKKKMTINGKNIVRVRVARCCVRVA